MDIEKRLLEFLMEALGRQIKTALSRERGKMTSVPPPTFESLNGKQTLSSFHFFSLHPTTFFFKRTSLLLNTQTKKMGGDHKCPVCQATFTRPQHVARHMRSRLLECSTLAPDARRWGFRLLHSSSLCSILADCCRCFSFFLIRHG
ncbi:hypothetical protein BDZ94DRAFT_358218 [Collybia nuda]|uniref:C2H2-type domain-containing protein n=1 Tax=Collybia nuda TaxID=64659 RepID=A0A9P5YI71_9AGAR|nr:hypothetical protein BDZ94DRAFT_358218 [Collybia nuda]